LGKRLPWLWIIYFYCAVDVYRNYSDQVM
jgi:hypothetical protein